MVEKMTSRFMVSENYGQNNEKRVVVLLEINHLNKSFDITPGDRLCNNRGFAFIGSSNTDIDMWKAVLNCQMYAVNFAQNILNTETKITPEFVRNLNNTVNSIVKEIKEEMTKEKSMIEKSGDVNYENDAEEEKASRALHSVFDVFKERMEKLHNIEIKNIYDYMNQAFVGLNKDAAKIISNINDRGVVSIHEKRFFIVAFFPKYSTFEEHHINSDFEIMKKIYRNEI